MAPALYEWSHSRGGELATICPNVLGYAESKLAPERFGFPIRGALTDGGGMRQIEGSSPDTLRRDLADVCVSFNSGIARLGQQNTGVLERTRVTGALYAGILRVHPFADGNHRTAFVALSAALWSLGLPAVEFADDTDMTNHDDAVTPALLSPNGDIEPFARLLATRIERVRKPAT